MQITISPASAADVRTTQDVFYKTWLATYPNKEAGITVDDIEDRFKDRFSEERIKRVTEFVVNPPAGMATLVAKESDTIVGVCRISVSEQENRFNAIYVLPEYQGKGIGNMLWNEVQKLFDPTKDIFVAVATYNTNAIEFYKRLGFTDTGKRWSDDKFIMKSGARIPEMEMVIKANT
jgi:ribosomal protein S18 acetylase RimI-like enzyme